MYLSGNEGKFTGVFTLLGVPHYDADGFLGFYGGCAETHADAAVSRIAELRAALKQMRDFADRLAIAEAQTFRVPPRGGESLEAISRRFQTEHRVRQNAAAQVGKLAADMLTYDRIPNGACLRSWGIGSAASSNPLARVDFGLADLNFLTFGL